MTLDCVLGHVLELELIGNLSITERTGKAIVNSYFLSLRIICEEKDDGFTVSHYQK